jgi:hypothetical protein
MGKREEKKREGREGWREGGKVGEMEHIFFQSLAKINYILRALYSATGQESRI